MSGCSAYQRSSIRRTRRCSTSNHPAPMMNPAPASDASINPTSWWLVANAARHDTNSTRVTPITTSPGMILLSFIDSPACGRVVLEWSTGSFGPFIGPPLWASLCPGDHGLISTVDLPDAVVGETVTETKLAGSRMLRPPSAAEEPGAGQGGHAHGQHQQHECEQEPARALPGPPRLMVSPRLISAHESAQSADQQDERCPEREDRAMGYPAIRCVCGRAVTGADPDSCDNKKRHAEHRDHEPEAHSLPDVSVVLLQV